MGKLKSWVFYAAVLAIVALAGTAHSTATIS